MNVIDNLIDEYEASAGLTLHSFILDSKYLIKIHQKNYAALLKQLEKYENDHIRSQTNTEFIRTMPSKRYAHAYRSNLMRHLHNFCSSLYTVEENYCEFLGGKSYRNAYAPELENEAMKIQYNPKRIFFFAIRNYFTHYRPPEISLSIVNSRVEADGEVFTVKSRGKVVIEKRFFTSDFNKVLWSDEMSVKSKLVKKTEWLRILNRYITFESEKGLSIEIKNVLLSFHEEFIEHFKMINERLIQDNQAEYQNTNRLLAKIIKLQDAL